MLGKRSREENDASDDIGSGSSETQKSSKNTTTNSRHRSPILDFFIIGAQKCGTMAAVKNLNKHPDIFVLREPHFFDLYYDMGIEWYRNKLRSSKPIIGEKTPELIYVDVCATRMKEICPDAKFILLLRDPVKRAFSSWNMQFTRNQESIPFSECVERELSTMMDEKRVFGTAEYHYVQKGFYMDQIERFLKVFPDRNKLLVLISERVQRNPIEEYQKIFNFLGARDYVFEAEDEHKGDYSSGAKISKKIEKKLRDLYAPHNERLYNFLGFRIPEWEPSDVILKAKPSVALPVLATTSQDPAASAAENSTVVKIASDLPLNEQLINVVHGTASVLSEEENK